MVDDTPPHGGHGGAPVNHQQNINRQRQHSTRALRGGHGGAPVNHQQNINGQRQHSTRVLRGGGSRRVRALARNRRIRTIPRGNTMALAQAMADGANGRRVANPPARPGDPLAGPGNPHAGPVNNPPAGVQVGNGAVANAGAPAAQAPAFQGFDIDAGFSGPPLRKSQVGPTFHSVDQPLPW